MSTIDSWYPLAEDYYESETLSEIPVRQGDLVQSPSTCLDSKGKPWFAGLVVHPSCELITGKSTVGVQVCRVRKLKDFAKKHQATIVAGETETGLIAHANTFFLPPPDEDGPFAQPMFADLRQVAMAPSEEVSTDHRIACLTHETRVHFIRRSLYWRQRWLLNLQDVQELETHRISNDPNFMGPRPDWAPLKT